MAFPRCLAVHHTLCITAYGAVNPCCASKDFKHVNDIDNIVEYFKYDKHLSKSKDVELNTEEWLPECIGCFMKAEKGLVSRKQKYTKWFPHAESLSYTNENPYAVVAMDISFGNSCNQKCIMCNSNFSSQWLKDDIWLKNEVPFLREQVGVDILYKNWSLSYDQLDQIVELVSKETKLIEIKGGEPLYDKRFSYFVNKCLDKNPEVKISTNTNGTFFTDKTLVFLKSIPSLNIDVSLDGTDKIYEWIRNTSFKSTEENIIRAGKYFQFTGNFTTSKYNLDNIEEFYNWMGDISKKIDRPIPLHFTQVVNQPTQMNPIYAPKESIQEGIKQLQIIREDPRGFADNGIYKERIDMLIKFLKNCMTDQDLLSDNQWNKCKQVDDAMAKIRGWDIRDYINL